MVVQTEAYARLLIGGCLACREGMNSTTEALVAEMGTLRAAVEAHKVKILAAAEIADEATEAAGIPTQYGLYTVDLSKEGWRYPSVQVAREAYEALCDDSGYFWACSRLADLERLLGLCWHGQLPLRTPSMYVPALCGHIPDADASVDPFIQGALS